MCEYSQLLKIADIYMLRGCLDQHLGIWRGKSGMSIFFFMLSKYTGNVSYEDFAGELLDDICSEISLNHPINFVDGLCGIGWTIEYLKSEGFIAGDTDYILSEIDSQIMERDVRRITDYSLESGLAGIVAYLQSRIGNGKDSGQSVFNPHYLLEVEHACQKAGIFWNSEEDNLSSVWKETIKHFTSTKIFHKESWQHGLTILNKLHVRHKKQSLSRSTINKKCLLVFSADNVANCYGIGTYIQQLVKCFNLNEWEINVITLDKAFINNATFKMEDGIGWYEFPTLTQLLPPYTSVSGKMDKYYKGIYYYLKFRLNSYDKIYCHFNFAVHHTLADLFKERSGASIIFTLHYTSWNILLQGDKELLKSRLIESDNKIKVMFEKERLFMSKCCDKIICVAKHAYDTVHQLYGIPFSKLAYIPHGIQDDYKKRDKNELENIRFKYGFTNDEKLIFYTGRLELGKGIVELVKAFKEVHKIIPNTKLIIAGNGNFNDVLKEANPKWNHIIYTGFISKEQLYELYSIAKVGVVPSFHEEFGYVAAEMMLHKLPVVVHNTMGLKEITDNGKYAIPFLYSTDRNITQLKDALLKILSQKKNMKLADESRKRIIEHYSFQKFQERTQSLYVEISNKKNNNLS